MTHEFAGKHSGKHPTGTVCGAAVAVAMKDKAGDSRITCSAAHKIARESGVPPSEIGKAAELSEFSESLPASRSLDGDGNSMDDVSFGLRVGAR